VARGISPVGDRARKSPAHVMKQVALVIATILPGKVAFL
jgi:hypothetical protein